MAEKQRFLMYFSYIGSGFWGSQYQFCKSTGVVYPTVQNSVETALKNIFYLKEERPIIAHLCSRTDSGVHALKAALQVDLPKFRNRFLRPIEIKTQVNKHLAKSKSCNIRILDVFNVANSFNIHESCLSKTYLYRLGILKKEFSEKNSVKKYCPPITEIQRAHFIAGKNFDFKAAEEATTLFVGEKDFAALGRRPVQNVRPTVCNILSFTIENAQPQIPFGPNCEKYDYYHFMCKGTRFLYHMVRSMVGVVLSVGIGRTTLDEVKVLFEKPEPSSWLSKFIVVPGCGLYLMDTVLDPEKINMEEKEENKKDCDSQDDKIKEKSSSAEAA